MIFGAGVRADGRPSPTLRRRIGYGLQAAASAPDAPILCSGAKGRVGPSEASVMARILEARGLPSARLVLDEASRDTLQSVLVARRFVRERGLSGCLVCSDRYHVPRIRLLLAALGVASAAGPLQAGRAGTPPADWIRMRLREALAIPYDLAVVLARRCGFLGGLG